LMKHIIQKNGLVIAGGVIQGLGMGMFLFPHSIPSGGAGGITVLLNYWFGINMGIALWIVNFCMLLIAVKYLGKRFALWTVIGVTVTPLSVDLFDSYFSIMDMDLLYNLVIGSIFLGTGIGLLMRQGVSIAGVGVIAFMIAHGKTILPRKPLFLIN